MATTSALADAGFHRCAVTARRLDIVHSEPPDAGLFCRLTVTGDVRDAPGVYAWAVDESVSYVGMSERLVVMVTGASLDRANNDYTYVPPSKALMQTSSPRVRVNALVNTALRDGSRVEWWWRETPSPTAAKALEAELISSWRPPWNRMIPFVPESVEPTLAVPVTETERLLGALRQYRAARQVFLGALGIGASNRDPLAEFAELITCAELGGTMATSRVQKGWDLLDPDGKTVQVRYVANSAGTWVNEPLIDFSGGCDRFALVVYEALDVRALLVFSAPRIAEVCTRLGKRHRDTDICLGLTQRNYLEILANQEEFGALGVNVHAF